MRLAVRLLRPAPNQPSKLPATLWQDPIMGYFETHGKTQFIDGHDYNMTDEQKKAVLHRYRVKEILKKEYLRREYDPNTFRYKEGVIVDPSMFRWYAADMSQAEFFRHTPRSIFIIVGFLYLSFYLYLRFAFIPKDESDELCLDGQLLWWDRQSARLITTGGPPHSTTYLLD